jgi:hypothetical protein
MTLELARTDVLLAAPALFALLLLLHRRRPRIEPLEVSSLLLWEGTGDERAAARRARRVSPRFWLQLLGLLLLVAALAGPTLVEPPRSGRRLLLLVDVSASMQARVAGSTRFELARAEVRRRLGALGPGDRAMLVAFSSRPRIVEPWTDRRARLDDALERLAPDDAPDGLRAALTLARAILRQAGTGSEAVLVSDRPVRVSGAPAGVSLETVAIGGGLDAVRRVDAPDDASAEADPSRGAAEIAGPGPGGPTDPANVAITGLDVSQGPFTALADTTAHATVRNFSSSRPVTLVARSGPAGQEAEIGRWTATLAADEQRVFVLRGIPAAGRVEFALAHDDEGDALAIDDRATTWIRPQGAVRTLAVSDDPALIATLRRLTEATGTFDLVPASIAGRAAGPAADHDLAIFHRASTAGWTKGALVIAPVEDELFSVGGTIGDVRTVDWDPSSPLARHLQYPLSHQGLAARVLVPRFDARPVVRVAAEHGDVPVVWAGEHGGRRVAALAFDIASLDLGAEENLPVLVLVLNALRWLDPLVDDLPAVVPTGHAPSVDETSHRLRSAPAGASFPFARLGEYVFDTPAGERRYVAELRDARESDLRVGASEVDIVWPAPVDAAAPSPQPEGPETGPLAPLLYGLALTVLAGEWWLYRRARGEAHA